MLVPAHSDSPQDRLGVASLRTTVSLRDYRPDASPSNLRRIGAYNQAQQY